MKNIFFIASAFLFLGAMCWVGCGADELQKPTIQEEIAVDEMVKKEVANAYSVNCSGDCDCALEGALGSPTWVQCKCDACTMNIVLSYANGEQSVQQVPEGIIEVPYFPNFESYMEETYVGQEYNLVGIDVVEAGEESTYTFSYAFLEGGDGTVLFAQSEKENWTVDCSGGCGCRSVFTFSPPSASCSCDDCTLSVGHEVSSESGDQ